MQQLKEIELKITNGMQKDLENPSTSPTQAFNLLNLKVQNLEEQTKNALVNEKGTIKLNKLNLPNTIENSRIIGVIRCGSNTNVIFTVLDNYNAIIRIDQETNNSPITARVLAEGNFNFGNFIEGEFCYENSELQKIYWIDGKNVLRYLNIKNENTITDPFYLSMSPTFKFDHRITVERIPGGGQFHSGVIQYAFSYLIKNGPETAIVDYTPLYHISELERGGKPDEFHSISFKVSIQNPDTRFDYIRLYSIIRTTKDSAPECKLVTDIKIK